MTGVNRGVLILGLVVGLPLVGLLFVNLGRDPSRIDSPIVGRAAPPFPVLTLGLTLPRPELYARIDTRVDAMLRRMAGDRAARSTGAESD